MTGKVFLCFKMSFATNFGRQDGCFSFYTRTRYVQYFSGPTCRVNPKPTEFSWRIAFFFTVWTWAFLQSSRIRSRSRCFRSIMCTGIASGVSLWWSDGGCQSPSVSKKMALEDRGFFLLILHTAGLCDLKGCIYVYFFNDIWDAIYQADR